MPTWALGGLVGIFGVCLGSFANVLVVRLKERSGVWGRSRCPHCLVPIKAQHLVPIISWVVLRGRCASCAKRIHPSYPVVEALMAGLALVAFFRHPEVIHGDVGIFLFEIVFAFVLLVAAAFDARWQLLPLDFLGGGGLLLAIWNVASGRLGPYEVFVGACSGAGFILCQYFVSRGKWVGMGDVWFAGFLGAALGFPLIWISFYVAYLMGGLIAAVLLVSRVAKRDSRIPFGPILAFGGFGAMWFGQGMLAFLHDLLAR